MLDAVSTRSVSHATCELVIYLLKELKYAHGVVDVYLALQTEKKFQGVGYYVQSINMLENAY